MVKPWPIYHLALVMESEHEAIADELLNEVVIIVATALNQYGIIPLSRYYTGLRWRDSAQIKITATKLPDDVQLKVLEDAKQRDRRKSIKSR